MLIERGISDLPRLAYRLPEINAGLRNAVSMLIQDTVLCSFFVKFEARVDAEARDRSLRTVALQNAQFHFMVWMQDQFPQDYLEGSDISQAHRIVVSMSSLVEQLHFALFGSMTNLRRPSHSVHLRSCSCAVLRFKAGFTKTRALYG